MFKQKTKQMKKNFAFKTVMVYTFLMFMLSSGFTQKMTSNPLVLASDTLSAALKFYDSSTNNPSQMIYMNDISTKALRLFKKTYKNISNEKWYIISNGYLAEFTIHDIKNRVVYDRNGSSCFYIQYYNEKKFPDKLTKIVKPFYYDYTIASVEEVQVSDKVFYIVHLQNETSLKTLRVTDDEMELIADFTRY
jgi:hypothetical protein